MASIDASIIGIKAPIEVKESNKNVRRAIEFMRDAAKADAEGEDSADMMGSMTSMLAVFDAAEDFVVSILKLSKTQIDKLEDLDNQVFMDFAVKVAGALMHMDTDAKPTEADQKSNG